MSGGESLRESAVFNLGGAVTMIVDDSPFSLTLTANALAGFGIRPSFAIGSGAEAKQLLAEKTIDLLVVDTDMPDIDGFEPRARKFGVGTGSLSDVADEPIEPANVLANDVEQLLAQRRIVDAV